MREDDEVSALVRARLEADGVQVLTGHKALAVEQDGEQRMLVCEHRDDRTGKVRVSLAFDAILVAVGRKPRVSGYGLEELNIPLDTSRHTIEVDDCLHALYPNIYACGDVSGPFQLTHAGAYQAWVATLNALFGSPLKQFHADYRAMPAVTFTDPEVARVGINEREAKDQGIEYEITRYQLAELDRALAERTTHGFVKILTEPGKDVILGVTCAGAYAGEWISEFALAMQCGIGLNKILGTVHAYPTFAEANKYAAGEWKKAHTPQTELRWSERWLRWR